jgi:hypothetical protein
VRQNRPLFCTSLTLHRIPNASGRPRYILAAPIPPNLARTEPSLSCYRILPSAHEHVSTILSSLCTDLRTPEDRRARRSVSVGQEPGWIPQAVFHLSGDLQNARSNSLISILLTRTTRYTSRTAAEEVTSSHSFLHIYDATHLPQTFDALLRDHVQQRRLRKVHADIGEEVPAMLGACTMAGVRNWVENNAREAKDAGGDEERWIVMKMMDQLQGLLWGVWLGMENGVEVDGVENGGCWPS